MFIIKDILKYILDEENIDKDELECDDGSKLIKLNNYIDMYKEEKYKKIL